MGETDLVQLSSGILKCKFLPMRNQKFNGVSHYGIYINIYQKIIRKILEENYQMIKFLLILLSIFLQFHQFSQARINKFNNNIYLEVFGNAGAYSLNYDRTIISDASLRGGIMVAKANNDLLFVFPLLVNYRFNIGRDFLEIGVGKTFVDLKSESKKIGFIELKGNLWTSVIGYRIQTEDGLNFRVAFTPFYYDRKFVPFGGFSIGYSF